MAKEERRHYGGGAAGSAGVFFWFAGWLFTLYSHIMNKKFVLYKHSPIVLFVLVIITLLSIITQPYNVFANPGWTLQIADPTTEAAFTSIALDSSNNPHIAYTSGGHRLWYTRWNGTSWDAPTVVDNTSGDIGWFTSIAIDSNDCPHISYYDHTNTSLKYAYYDGTWHTETVDNTGEVAVFGTSLALDNSDHPHISYMTRGALVDLKYARHDGATWNIETVDSADAVGYYSSLALDSNYYPHISYIDKTNSKLKYARWTGSAWDIQTLYDIDATSIEWPAYNKHTSIALDISGYAHISYWKPSGLWYARYNGTTWSEEKVSGSGKYNRLALDSNNLPHISYQSADELSLKYARFDGTGWTTETVDSSGDPLRWGGRFAAITVDSNGWPHISYQCWQGDWSTGKAVLKYARYDGYLPPPPAVGGEAYSINKVGLIAPWLALVIAIAAGGIYVTRRKTQSCK